MAAIGGGHLGCLVLLSWQQRLIKWWLSLCKLISRSCTKFDRITPVLNQLQWLPVKHQIRFRDNLLVFKCLNRLAPDYLCEKFYFRSKVHNRNTRNCNQLNIPKYRSTTGQRTFTYRGVKVWNERGNSIKYEIDSFKQFKTNLKAEFLEIV